MTHPERNSALEATNSSKALLIGRPLSASAHAHSHGTAPRSVQRTSGTPIGTPRYHDRRLMIGDGVSRPIPLSPNMSPPP